MKSATYELESWCRYTVDGTRRTVFRDESFLALRTLIWLFVSFLSSLSMLQEAYTFSQHLAKVKPSLYTVSTILQATRVALHVPR